MVAPAAVPLDGRGLTLFTVLAGTDQGSPPNRADVVRLEGTSLLVLARSLQNAMVYRQASTVLYTPQNVAPLNQLVLTTVVHQANGNVSIRVDGQERELGLISIDATQTMNVELGSRDFRGEIAALLVYSRALDLPDVENVEAYLQSVWNCCN